MKRAHLMALTALGYVLFAKADPGLMLQATFRGVTNADFALGSPLAVNPKAGQAIMSIRPNGIDCRRGAVAFAAIGNITNVAGTIAFQFRPNASSSEARSFTLFEWRPESADEGPNVLSLQFRADARPGLLFRLRGGVPKPDLYLGVEIDWNGGEWHHLAVSWDPRDARIYWDGSLIARSPVNAIVGIPGPHFVVGGALGGGSLADGLLADFRVYSKPLIDREVSVLSGSFAEPLLKEAIPSQTTLLSPANTIEYRLGLRGVMDTRHTLRFSLATNVLVTIPWADTPVFQLPIPFPLGYSTGILEFLQDGRPLKAVTNVFRCVPDPAEPAGTGGRPDAPTALHPADRLSYLLSSE